MFLDIEKHERSKIAIKDDGGVILTYGEICDLISTFKELALPRSIVFCLCTNCAASLVGYLAFESNGQVPLLLSANIDTELREELEKEYLPSYYWIPQSINNKINGVRVFEAYGYELVKSDNDPYRINDALSLLLTTSGSTGSPKLVRHKYGNLETNAKNVAKVFEWTSNEIGICELPMNYTMGLNVINSHMVVGASVLLIRTNLMDPDFWDFIKENKGTNFCGVPFSYEVMRRIGFDKMDLPSLYTLAEGGGKLTDKMFLWVAEVCKKTNRRFIATFGTSETSARMSFLAPQYALERVASIGKAIPGGELFLIDASVDEEGESVGELGYRGPNVTMGYAYSQEDLIKGDEWCGEYHTGDIAKRDKDGFYYIIGRKGRFLKLFGLRVSLDETERILKMQYPFSDFACMGDDKCMDIYYTEVGIKDQIIPYICKKTNIHNSAFRIFLVDTLPRNERGKIDYNKLKGIRENA